MKYIAPIAEAVELDVVNVLLASASTPEGEECTAEGTCATDGLCDTELPEL